MAVGSSLHYSTDTETNIIANTNDVYYFRTTVDRHPLNVFCGIMNDDAAVIPNVCILDWH